MIYSLNGELIHLDALGSAAVIECAGVGYRVTVPSGTLARLPSVTVPPKKVRLYTHLQLREDAAELYGFLTEEELTMFKLLITVSGVGPKAAVSILSLFTPQKLAEAIAAEDAKAISKAPNVGAKTAGRIILDLKSRLAKDFPLSGSASADETEAAGTASDAGKLEDAREALLVLGYTRTEVNAALKQADTAQPLEDIIRRALAVLMKP